MRGRGSRPRCRRLPGLALLAALAAPTLAQTPWTPADPAYVIELPRDHASHPDAKIEWWYYTGNVTARDRRRFGYQLTFFRVGVNPAPRNPSRWAVRDLLMTHLAVTDIEGRRHRYAERLNRAGVGWAGAATDRYDVWNDDWRARLDPHGRHVLTARAGGLGLRLTLEPGKAVALHGEGGFSRKGSEPGNASHYYSLTRMPTSGQLVLDGETVDVDGLSWMDHEFGSSFLEPAQVGWDWFSIQLDHGADLMVFRMRRRDDRPDAHSSGTLVHPDGRTQTLAAGEFRLTPGDRWQSAASGAAYPIAWRIEVPGAGLTLDARAALPDQELRTDRSTGVIYWEGSIEARGTWGRQPVEGRGYLEMTGYTGAPMSDVLR